jgi:rSAM/selenodomain-associated transferase 1
MQPTLSRTSSCALLIFTRNPELGKCKTRLAATIGDRAALEVYRFLLQHTAKITGKLDVADKFVYFSEQAGDGSIWDPETYSYCLQTGEDLGARMSQAFLEAFSRGYSRVIVIGSDLYDLATEDLRQGFLELEQHEAVIGPAADGGYYLLGLKRHIPEVFSGKAWGSDTVLEDTLRDLEKKDTCLLAVRNDVDHYEDIRGNPIFETIINESGND